MNTEIKEVTMKDRLLKVYHETLNNPEWNYDVKFEDLDCYSILCKGMTDEKEYKLFGCNVNMFNYVYQDYPSILMLFSKYNSTEETNKNTSEKIIEIARNLENTFVVIDYIISKEVKEEKYMYVLAIKKIV